MGLSKILDKIGLGSGEAEKVKRASGSDQQRAVRLPREEASLLPKVLLPLKCPAA